MGGLNLLLSYHSIVDFAALSSCIAAGTHASEPIVTPTLNFFYFNSFARLTSFAEAF